MGSHAHSPALIRLELHRHGLAHQRFRASVARATGLHDSDVTAIAHLSLSNAITPTQLAARMQLSSGGISVLIHRLEQRGYVTETPSPSDGRSRLVVLTPRAMTDLAPWYAYLVESLDHVLDDLSTEQRAAAHAFLQHVVDAVTAATDTVDREASRTIAPNLLSQTAGLWG